MSFPSLNEQMDVIRSGAVEVLPEEEIAQKIERAIRTNKPLNIKLGCDPSRPDLHIGHAVVLHKLRQFQDLGHQAILIVGDFTAMIGDPTGRSKTRPALSLEETRTNGQTYFNQATRVLASKRVTMVYNSDWLARMNFQEVIALAARYTVSQMLEREDFHQRFDREEPISLHEFLYPLAQAMDSVFVESDIELGGTDQKFNLLVGREIQRQYNMEPQGVITTPLLEGTDGVEKMSKSLGNYIALSDIPRDMFGKTMSIPDTLITRYYRYGAWASEADIRAMAQGLEDGSLHPRDAKVKTAMAIVERYYGERAARQSFEEFERIFVKKDIPDEIETLKIDYTSFDIPVTEALVRAGLAASKSEARRLIQQGGVSIDSNKVDDIASDINLEEQKLFKVGKKRFLYIGVNRTDSVEVGEAQQGS